MARHVSRREFIRDAGILGGFGLLGGDLLAACGSSGGGGTSAAAPLKVGVITSLSGADAQGGELTKRGYDFWAQTINKQGGVLAAGKRHKVKMFYADDKSDPSTGPTAAERMITQDNVDVVLGPYTSGVQIAVDPITDKYKVPMLAGSAESPGVWSPKPAFAYGLIPSVDLTANKALKILVQQASPRPTSAAILGADEPFSKDAAAGFAVGANEIGLTIVKNTLYPPTADVTPLVSQIATQKPDIVAVGGHESTLIALIKALAAQNFTPKAVIMHYGVTDPAFVQGLHKMADGVFGLTDWTPDLKYSDSTFGTAKNYAANYKKRYGVDSDYTGAACAACGLVIQRAMSRLGKAPPYSQSDRQKLNDLIASTNIKTFYGPVKFDTSGAHMHDNTLLTPILVQIQKGSVVSVGPSADKKANMIYPLPSLTAR